MNEILKLGPGISLWYVVQYFVGDVAADLDFMSELG